MINLEPTQDIPIPLQEEDQPKEIKPKQFVIIPDSSLDELRKPALEYERQVLSFSGLKIDSEIQIFDVPIKYNKEDHYIHTIRCGDAQKPKLVMFHGYGGSLILYYKMLKELTEKFEVYCIDFLGLALSSKPKVQFKNVEETIDFFISSVEKWVDYVELTEFHLGGHSLGGYIAMLYSLFGKKKVNGMYLFSPAGTTKRTEDEINFRDRIPSFCFLKKKIVNWYMNIWDKNMSFQEVKESKPETFSKFLNRFVRWRMGVSNKGEQEALKGYFNCMFSMPESAEKCLYTLFHPVGFGKANMDIEEYLNNYIKCEVIFFFGSRDWMSNKGAKALGKDKTKPNFKYKKVWHAGHQLIAQNPKVITNTILGKK